MVLAESYDGRISCRSTGQLALSLSRCLLITYVWNIVLNALMTDTTSLLFRMAQHHRSAAIRVYNNKKKKKKIYDAHIVKH